VPGSGTASGEEISEKLDVEPARMTVLQYRRHAVTVAERTRRQDHYCALWVWRGLIARAEKKTPAIPGRAWGIRNRRRNRAARAPRPGTASINTSRCAYTIGELLELGLLDTRGFVAVGRVDRGRRLARARMSGVIGGQGFHDVDPLYDAPLAQAFRTGSSNRHAMQASARDSVAQRVDFALLAGRRPQRIRRVRRGVVSAGLSRHADEETACRSNSLNRRRYRCRRKPTPPALAR
jgi:hypothetical protein